MATNLFQMIQIRFIGNYDDTKLGTIINEMVPNYSNENLPVRTSPRSIAG